MKKRRQWNTKYFQISKIYTSGIQKNSKKTNWAAVHSKLKASQNKYSLEKKIFWRFINTKEATIEYEIFSNQLKIYFRNTKKIAKRPIELHSKLKASQNMHSLEKKKKTILFKIKRSRKTNTLWDISKAETKWIKWFQVWLINLFKESIFLYLCYKPHFDDMSIWNNIH